MCSIVVELVHALNRLQLMFVFKVNKHCSYVFKLSLPTRQMYISGNSTALNTVIRLN